MAIEVGMVRFRFTMNVDVVGVKDAVFEKLAGSVLDYLLESMATEDAWDNSRVLGRLDQARMKIILEFQARSHNAAHTFGFERVARAFDHVGGDTSSWYDTPHVVATEDDGADGWDVLVEELRSARLTPADSRVELVLA